MNSDRRDFLKMTLGLAAGLAAAGTAAWAQDQPKAKKGKGKGKGKRKGKKNGQAPAANASQRIPLAVQLYAVRGEFEKDVPGSLKKVAEMGYEAVEFWGYGGTKYVFKDKAGKEWSAEELKKLLDENKLKACGIHCSAQALDPARIQTTIDNNKILGNNLLNIASPPKGAMESVEAIKKFAEFLNKASDTAMAQGMHVGYHAHKPDFVKIGDDMAYNILFSQLKPEVNMQVDIGHCINAGADPIGVFKAYPGRSISVHIREVPAKNMNFDSPGYKEIWDTLENVAGTKWYIVEEEAGTDFTYSQKAIEKLKKLGK